MPEELYKNVLPLIKVLSDDEEWVRDAAKDALKKLGHEEEVQ